jgi:hypothetical protein
VCQIGDKHVAKKLKLINRLRKAGIKCSSPNKIQKVVISTQKPEIDATAHAPICIQPMWKEWIVFLNKRINVCPLFNGLLEILLLFYHFRYFGVNNLPSTGNSEMTTQKSSQCFDVQFFWKHNWLYSDSWSTFPTCTRIMQRWNLDPSERRTHDLLVSSPTHYHSATLTRICVENLLKYIF